MVIRTLENRRILLKEENIIQEGELFNFLVN